MPSKSEQLPFAVWSSSTTGGRQALERVVKGGSVRGCNFVKLRRDAELIVTSCEKCTGLITIRRQCVISSFFSFTWP